VCRWYGLQTVYLVNGPRGWELAGVDVKQRSFARRLLPKARVCPSPDRAIDWADLQTFVPRFTDPALPAEPDPAAAAGPVQVDWWLIARVLLCVGSDGKLCPSSRSGGGRAHPGDLVADGEALGHLVPPSGCRLQMPTRTKMWRDVAER
jgi:hypothetical protein